MRSDRGSIRALGRDNSTYNTEVAVLIGTARLPGCQQIKKVKHLQKKVHVFL